MTATDRSAADPAPYPPFTEEHELFRASVKRFCLEEVAPYAHEWEDAGEYPRELFRKAADLGLFGIRIDPAHGGAGMDWWASATAYDALRYTDFPSLNIGLLDQMDLAIPLLDKLGSDEIKREFMRPAVAGESIGALGISEPGCGSDVAAMRTAAREDGGDLVISGQKLWITNGATADYILLAVRTAEHRHKGISMVVFPTGVKGYRVGRKLKKVGNAASDTCELFFDECRIPKRYILGERNQGFYYIMEHFQGERLATALMTNALMDRALELAVRYGKERHAFGQPVGSFQVWRHRFAEHLASVEASRQLTYHAVERMNGGKQAQREITMAKLFATELAQRLTYDCQQIFGGFGYTTEYPIGRIWRDVRLYTIGAGTSEIMKEILAKEEGL